ncbi:MAG: SMP-30/gluconolactonase/LRE family protein [Bacteroidota bacterium]
MKSPLLHVWLFAGCLFLGLSPNAAQTKAKSKIIKKGATLQKIGEGYIFTEGPAVDKAGNVYFTDQPNNRIVKWSTDGQLNDWMTDAGRSNGLYFDHDGALLSCADEKNELWRIDENKDVKVLLSDFEGKRFNGPNDLWIDPKGGIYFTDPFYKRDWWKHSEPELERQNVYYLSPDRTTLRMVASDFVRPNGIIGTRDGETLYIADIGDDKTYRFEIAGDGSLQKRKLFCELGSDGMTLDRKGNLYLTGKGVTVFNESGEQIEHIAVDEKWTANVTFGGRKRKLLFITAMGSVYGLDMRVKGN